MTRKQGQMSCKKRLNSRRKVDGEDVTSVQRVSEMSSEHDNKACNILVPNSMVAKDLDHNRSMA